MILDRGFAWIPGGLLAAFWVFDGVTAKPGGG